MTGAGDAPVDRPGDGSGHQARHDERYRVAAGALRARMVRRIVAGGGLADPAWRRAFAEVPRHLFVLGYGLDEVPDGAADGEAGGDGSEAGGERGGDAQGDWRGALRRLAWAYADRPIATHVVGGELVSSSSQPSLMALMCQALDVADGHTVLEIGAGTGYNAALLAHRLGPDAVTTIDLDADITAAARRHLDAYGTPAARSVAVVTGDGALGWPERAPYDRIMATCELPSIPAAWLEQCRPGGLILAPFATGLVALTVHGPGRAQGRFLHTPAFFVALRGPGARGVGGPAGPGGGIFGGAGHADRSRYGMTVDGGRQRVWLDDPDGPDSWDVTP